MSNPVMDKEERFLGQMVVYQQILDAIADMVLVKGANSRILWANKAFCDYYGMSNEQLRNLIDASFNEVDYTAQYVRDDASVYTTGVILNIPDEPVTRHDGLVQIFNTVKSPIRDLDGQIIMTVGVSRNITDQKRAKEDLQRYQLHLERIVEERTTELSQLNENLTTILASLNEGIVAFDRNWRIQRVNRAAETFLGTSTSDLVGACVRELVNFEPEATERQQSFNWENRSENPVEGYLRTKANERRLVSVQVLPLGETKGMAVGSVLVIRDIAMEREVANQRLRHQKLESLGLLAGGIAHDFNNILAGILGSISIARLDSHHSDNIDQLLDQAERACQRARGLTRQLLTFSRGGAPVKKPIRVLGLVREAAELALSGSSCRLEMTATANVSLVSADEGQIAQVVNNLVINANQAMPVGGQVTVHVGNIVVTGTEQLAVPPGKYVKITVRDHGTGILPEHLDRIFDPYFSTKPKGSGLGLASVHSIMKQHNGYVMVTSTPSVGTQFSLYLPTIESESSTEATIPLATDTAKTMRVLVLDDDEAVRGVIGSMLAILGQDAVVVGTSIDAFDTLERELAANNPFDAIFVDLTMPGDLSGKEVIERLRARDVRAKIVVMSGYSTDPVMANFEGFGLSARLQKPFTVADLRELLGSLGRRAV